MADELVTMIDEWVGRIEAMLADSLGTRERKEQVREAAATMQVYLRGVNSPAAEYLRRLFEAWVHHMWYLAPSTGVADHLPATVIRSDAEIGIEYGLTTKQAIRRKQELIAEARTARINRAAAHLEAGWRDFEAVHFCAARDEWEMAKRKAGVEAA